MENRFSWTSTVEIPGKNNKVFITILEILLIAILALGIIRYEIIWLSVITSIIIVWAIVVLAINRQNVILSIDTDLTFLEDALRINYYHIDRNDNKGIRHEEFEFKYKSLDSLGYSADTKNIFISGECKASARFPNGNSLLDDSKRLMEVSMDGYDKTDEVINRIKQIKNKHIIMGVNDGLNR